VQPMSRSQSLIDTGARLCRSVQQLSRERIWDAEMAVQRSKSAVLRFGRDERRGSLHMS